MAYISNIFETMRMGEEAVGVPRLYSYPFITLTNWLYFTQFITKHVAIYIYIEQNILRSLVQDEVTFVKIDLFHCFISILQQCDVGDLYKVHFQQIYIIVKLGRSQNQLNFSIIGICYYIVSM